MPRKKSIKSLRTKLTKLTSEYIKKRDHHVCQRCCKHVSGHNEHVSHVIPKSRGNALRWDVNNLKVLCFHDHINWWHKNPTESGEWFKREFPGRWDYLAKNKNKIVKFKVHDYEQMIEDIKLKLEEI